MPVKVLPLGENGPAVASLACFSPARAVADAGSFPLSASAVREARRQLALP